jgi:hypothetical protein
MLRHHKLPQFRQCHERMLPFDLLFMKIPFSPGDTPRCTGYDSGGCGESTIYYYRDMIEAIETHNRDTWGIRANSRLAWPSKIDMRHMWDFRGWPQKGR